MFKDEQKVQKNITVENPWMFKMEPDVVSRLFNKRVLRCVRQRLTEENVGMHLTNFRLIVLPNRYAEQIRVDIIQ